jgi:hypothetical protein
MRRELLLALTLSQLWAARAYASPTLEDYRYFRALSLDLQGRTPTRAEIAAFESSGFDLDAWIDSHLSGQGYAQRIETIYLDLLRLQINPNFQYVTNTFTLRRVPIMGPDGKPLNVFYRAGQRRTDLLTDGIFCLTPAQTGLTFVGNTLMGTATPVDAAVLDAATVVVDEPWWLQSGWPGFTLAPSFVQNPDKTPMTSVRVCKEEASTNAVGTIYASGRTKNMPSPPPGRNSQPPVDLPYATANAGQPIDCVAGAGTAFAISTDCGCGVGLARCLPSDSTFGDGSVFVFPSRIPLGWDQPFDSAAQGVGAWLRFWWNEEAVHFLNYILTNDRDFREVLTGRYTLVNGPLAQYYSAGLNDMSCCSSSNNTYYDFSYNTPTPLVSPTAVPQMAPQDVTHWQVVPDRGPNASGILTMPAYLGKNATARSRAHWGWVAFECMDFVAPNLQLEASSEPDLTKRPGCQACHATLEPLAAYFARIQPSGWTFWPPDHFPTQNPYCKSNGKGGFTGAGCSSFYDITFSTTTAGMLRSAYAAPDHADKGAQGMAAQIVNSPAFAPCVAQNVASSFLGRTLTSDDDALKAQLADALTQSGYHMSALVRALVHSDAYKKANDLNSTLWRQGGGQ